MKNNEFLWEFAFKNINSYFYSNKAFLQPSGDTVAECGETVSLSGYAFSGGGNGIIRVDISIDGGKNWAQAEIKNENDPYSQRSFAWTLWNFEVNKKIT